MSRLSKEQEAEIRERDDATSENTRDYCDVCQLLTEIRDLRRERDKAIVRAYRAAAEHSNFYLNSKMAYQCECGFTLCHFYKDSNRAEVLERQKQHIIALTPQSALDAVERREREIACIGLELGKRHGENILGTGIPPTADDVLAKVGRGR